MIVLNGKVINNIKVLGILHRSENTIFVYILNAEYSDICKRHINKGYLEPYFINTRQNKDIHKFVMPIFTFIS